MSTYESHKATVEARKAVIASTAPTTRHEAAMLQYLDADARLAGSIRRVEKRPAAGEVAPSTTPHHATEVAQAQATDHSGNLVVVGVDGSECARGAAQWAADEAFRRHAALRLVNTYMLPSAGYSNYNPYPADLLTQLQLEGAGILSETAEALRQDYPTVEISTRQVHGDAATGLRRASADAVLTVVGKNGRHRVTLGSVAADIAASNPVPVAVIGRGNTHPDGPVVVGVDGSPASEAGAGFAFAAAALRSAPLVALHCWTDPVPDVPAPARSVVTVEPQPHAGAHRTPLTESLAGWAARYPGVHVQQVLVHDRPTSTMLKYAGTAQLVVVGTRGHGRLTRMLLGSTSRALINLADCPVVVARPHPAG